MIDIGLLIDLYVFKKKTNKQKQKQNHVSVKIND